jgi:hypothetical protein
VRNWACTSNPMMVSYSVATACGITRKVYQDGA